MASMSRLRRDCRGHDAAEPERGPGRRDAENVSPGMAKAIAVGTEIAGEPETEPETVC
jgi:hypothetical protein